MQEGEEILIISTLIITLIVIFLIVLFTVFQRRKNQLLHEKESEKKRYEQEITEAQIEIREETLRNISWELHDNIGQLLTLAKIQIQNATPDNIEEVTETISKSLQEIRSLSKLINPDFIKNIELQEALQLEVERFNRLNYINASLQIIGKETPINKKHGVIIFRMLQEFFSNTLKHSKASHLEVSLHFKKEQLEIIAKDNGIGFDISEYSLKGIGIQNIKNRAELINAIFNFNSTPNKGTVIKINYYFSNA